MNAPGEIPLHIPSEQIRHAMKPAGWVVFWRTFLPYQIYRFFWINIRMIRMILKSH
jgi:hypothetical protein